MKHMLLPISCLFLLSHASAQSASLAPASIKAMAKRIVSTLKPSSGEHVILRFDPKTLPQLEPELRAMLEARGALVETLPYGPAPDLEQKLTGADIYIWLPAGPGAVTPPAQAEILARWLDSGRGRQVHFHWGDGTRGPDGLNGVHSPIYDRMYLDALAIDYGALDKRMNKAVARLRAGEIRITTPAGTDLRFSVGDRPFCKQNGDASKKRMESARVRIDREIELPAGALRVAPIEESVNGVMVVPWLRVDDSTITNARLEFARGVITHASAADGGEALQRYLKSGPGLVLFREFALGFNPKLTSPSGEKWVPYYGYGNGVVRLGLGDNSELGGSARGFPVRWLFFPDATVRVGTTLLVRDGRMSRR